MATRCRSSVTDAELFSNGLEEPPCHRDSPEEPPCVQRAISMEGKEKQKQFRTSRSDKEFEDDADDVFVGTDTPSEVKPRSERSVSDSILPDLVLSSASTKSDGGFESDEATEESPDVVRGKNSPASPKTDGDSNQGSLEEGRSIVGVLQTPTAKSNKPPKVKRSVSFQEEVKYRKDSSSMDTQSRRKEYRKSSGYGTGSGGSDASLQSQISTASNISQEREWEGQTGVGRSMEPVGPGLSWRYEGDKRGVHIVPEGRPQQAVGGPVVGNGQFSVNDNIRYTTNEDDYTVPPIQSQIPLVVASLLNEPSYEDMPSSELPNLSIMIGSVEIDDNITPAPQQGNRSSNYLHEGVDPTSSNRLSRSSQREVDSNECNQIGGSNNFPDLGADDQSHNDSSVMLPEFGILLQQPETPGESPSLSKEKKDIIIKKYCTPEHHPSLPSTGTPDNFRIPEQAPLTPEAPVRALTSAPPSTGHSSYGISHMISAFYKNPEIFNFEVEGLQNLLRIIGTPSSLHCPRDGSMASEVSVSCVEIASRCKDKDCSLTKCQAMKAALIGLQHALDGFLDINTSPEVQNLCMSLYAHAKNCEEPPMRCTVPWCHLLRRFSEMDDVRSVDVFLWIKRQFDTPVFEEDVFPEEDHVQHFIKIQTSHHHTSASRFEVTCRIEQPGHYGNVALVAETTPPLASFDAEMSTTDHLYVIKQEHEQSKLPAMTQFLSAVLGIGDHLKTKVIGRISNDESDFEETQVYQRLQDLQHPNLIRHYWIAVYPSYSNICLQYIQGDTLEMELQRRMLFDPHMVLQMMMEILDAVDFLHKHGIIYLYWSLGNILLDGQNRRLIVNNLTLSVTDDGQYDVGYTKQSLPTSLVPPEILEGETLTHDSDCWGAACMMVHLLSGHQIWYTHRHDSREELWEKVRSGCCPFTSEEGKIKQATLLALLKNCFKIKLRERISFVELLRRIKAATIDGNFGHLSDDPQNNT